jgi:hypothetical protein
MPEATLALIDARPRSRPMPEATLALIGARPPGQTHA